MKNILFVASEPQNLHSTECSSEHKHLLDALINANLKDDFSIKYLDHVTSDELIDKIRKIAPEYIHYCGHGNIDGEMQVSKPDGIAHSFRSDMLVKFLRGNHRLECIILCSCNSENLVEEIKSVSNYVIGFRGNVRNSDMHLFTTDFYSELFEVGSPLHAYLNTIDKIKSRKQQGNYLIFRTKLNYVMESVLNKELSIAQAKEFALREEIVLSDQLLSVANHNIEGMEEAYSQDFLEVMKTHPTPSEVIWFSSNKDALANKVAATLYRRKSREEIEDFAEEIKLLYFAFEIVLVYYEDEAGAVDNFKIAVEEYPAKDYIDALEELKHIKFGVNRSENFNILYSKSIEYSLSIVVNLTS